MKSKFNLLTLIFLAVSLLFLTTGCKTHRHHRKAPPRNYRRPPAVRKGKPARKNVHRRAYNRRDDKHDNGHDNRRDNDKRPERRK